jgi:Fic family protein
VPESVNPTGLCGESIPKSPQNVRQKLALQRPGDQPHVERVRIFLTTSKYAKLAKCSTDTVLRDIQDLLARGILLKNRARGRSMSYRLTNPQDVAD